MVINLLCLSERRDKILEYCIQIVDILDVSFGRDLYYRNKLNAA